MKVKVSEATNLQLDWLVWNCVGGASAYPKTAEGPAFLKLWKGNSAKYIHPTTDWSQGGPIIERENINLGWLIPAHQHRHLGGCWSSFIPGGSGRMYFGPTPLIAAMRCFAASRLGDEVEIPEELA